MRIGDAEHHLIALFYRIDNFYKVFEEVWKKIILENKDPSLRWQKTRKSSLSLEKNDDHCHLISELKITIF